MFSINRPSKKLIDQIRYDYKDPLWSNVNYFEEQLENLMITSQVEPFKSNVIRKLQVDSAMKNYVDMRDFLILAKYN